MNKKILLTTIAFTLMSTFCLTYAQDNTEIGTIQKTYKNAEKMSDFQGPPPNGEMKRHHGDMRKFHPSKADLEKKKAEFEKRLKLTDEQKQQIETNRKQGHEKVKPIFEQQRAKMHEIRKIKKDNSFNETQKQQKIEQLKNEIKELTEQANAYREQNVRDFENILDDKQKKEFNKIKQEQKKEMEKLKKNFEKKFSQKQKNGNHFLPPNDEEKFPQPPISE